MLTTLNLIPNNDIKPNIHIQLTAIGRNDNKANSMLPNENQRKKNTIKPQAQPI